MAVAAATAAARFGGRSLSISALPNSHPGGRVSSLHRASRTVLSHTRDVYSLESPLRTVRPSSEPQWLMERERMSLWPVRHTWTNIWM